MPVAAGQVVLPASVAIFNGASTGFLPGTLSNHEPLFGVVDSVSEGDLVTVLWNNGRFEADIQEDGLRRCAVPATANNALYGKTVQLGNAVAGAGPEFRGRVQAVVKVALSAAGDQDPTDDVVVVRTPERLWFLAKVADVSVV